MRRTNLDGSNMQVIRDNLDNPNGLAFLSDRMYIVDSREKTRDQYNPNYPSAESNATLYMRQGENSEWRTVSGLGLKVSLVLHC